MSNQLSLRNPSSWLVLGCITLLQAINGARYSIFSECSTTTISEKQHCHFSYMQLNNLMVSSEIGKLFGVLSGIAADYLPASIILIVGLIFGLVGYGVQYLYIAHKISSLSYSQILLLNALAGHSTCWVGTYCYVLAMRNFNASHGTMIAITSSYSAFSGKICSILVDSIQGKEASQTSLTSLFFMWLAPTAIGLTVATIDFGLKYTQYEGNKEMSAISFLLAISSGVYIVIESVIPKFTHIYPRFRAVVLLFVLMLPFVIALIVTLHPIKKSSPQVMPEMSNDYFESTTKKLAVREREIEEKVNEVLMERNDCGWKDLLINTNFWLFYLVNSFGAVLAIVYMINLRRISESFSSNQTLFLLEVSSTFGFFGRIFTVLFEWHTRKSSIISYPTLTVLLMLPMPIAIFLLLSNSIRCFYISTVVIGTCSGALSAITSSTMYGLFGDKNFVAKQTIFLTSIPLGLLLFGFLASLNYQREGKENHGSCFGMLCYSRIFIIWGFISIIGILLSFILHLRVHNLYLHRSLLRI